MSRLWLYWGKREMVSRKDSIHPIDSHWFCCLAPWSKWGFLDGRRQTFSLRSPSSSPKTWWLTINVCGRNLWSNLRDYNLPKKPEVNIFVRIKWAAQHAQEEGPASLRIPHQELSPAHLGRTVLFSAAMCHTQVPAPCVCREKTYLGVWWLLLFCFLEDFFLP